MRFYDLFYLFIDAEVFGGIVACLLGMSKAVHLENIETQRTAMPVIEIEIMKQSPYQQRLEIRIEMKLLVYEIRDRYSSR